MDLHPSRHLAGLTKDICYDDFSDSRPPLRTSKSYCANSDIFNKAYFPRPRELAEEEYRRQAAFLWKHCSR